MNAIDIPRIVMGIAAAGAVLLAAGCGSNTIRAQWTDPEFANRPLQGATVMVRCEARELTVRRVCMDQVSQQVRAAGGDPVPAPETAEGLSDEGALAAAREVQARAVLTSRMEPGATVAAPRSRVGIGMGSWSGNVGTSVGMSAPVGAQRVNTSYTAEMRLTDVASGRLMWTSSLGTPASGDVTGQISQIARSGVEAAKKAGLF
jgi:hypothetical protein